MPIVLNPDMNNHGGARVFINGRKCSFASVRSYAEYCNLTSPPAYYRDVEAAVAMAIERKHALYWINLESSVLSGDPGYYEREAAKWADAPSLLVGDVVEFEGKLFEIKPAFNGNFNPVAI